jgi:hypothetical protein
MITITLYGTERTNHKGCITTHLPTYIHTDGYNSISSMYLLMLILACCQLAISLLFLIGCFHPYSLIPDFGSSPFDNLLHFCAHLLHSFTLNFPECCISTLAMSSNSLLLLSQYVKASFMYFLY